MKVINIFKIVLLLLICSLGIISCAGPGRYNDFYQPSNPYYKNPYSTYYLKQYELFNPQYPQNSINNYPNFDIDPYRPYSPGLPMRTMPNNYYYYTPQLQNPSKNDQMYYYYQNYPVYPYNNRYFNNNYYYKPYR